MGGKYKGVPQLLQHFPLNLTDWQYIEPFAGGLVVFFNVKPKSAVLNDVDLNLTNFWWVLSPESGLYDRFVESCCKRGIYDVEYLLLLEKSIPTMKQDSDEQRIARAKLYYLANRMSFSGVKFTDLSKLSEIIPHRNKLHENLDIWHTAFEEADVRIWHKDFRDVFDRYKKSSDKWTKKFFYCDPPYVVGGEYYDNGFTVKDHEDLAQCLYECTHDWVLSYDDTEKTRERYEGYYIKEASWFKSVAGGNTEQKPELIISNREGSIYEV